MQSQEFFRPIKSELQRTEEELIKAIDTQQPLLKEASGHLIHAGGKRLRPAFVLGRPLFYQRNRSPDSHGGYGTLAMATLVHDDVIDNSLSRRGRETVKALW